MDMLKLLMLGRYSNNKQNPKKPNISSGKRGREKESMALNNMAKLKTALRMLKEPMDSPH